MLSLKDRSHDKEVEFLIRWRKETERIYLSGHIRTRFNNKIDKNNTSQISFFRYLPHTNSPVCPPTMSMISTTSPHKQGWPALPPRTPRPPPPGARPPASPALRGDAAWPDWNVYFSHFVIICFTLTTKDWSSPASAAHQGVPTVTFLVSLKMSLMRSTMWSPRSKQTIITF